MPAEKTHNNEEATTHPEEANPVERQLSFVGRFIDRYYLQQSKAVQTGTFIVFVLLFAYGFMNMLTGKYVLKGNLLAEGPKTGTQSGPVSYAAYYGVRWGTDDFASNSKGEYYVALGFVDYLRAVMSGGHDIRFLQLDPKENKERVVWSGIVGINRMDGEFHDITIPYAAPMTPESASPPGARNWTMPQSGSILFPTAWASVAVAPGMYELLIQNVRLSSGAGKANATIELVVEDQTLEMRDHNMSDLAAGHIPLTRDQNLDLGSNLYFAIPGNALPVRGKLQLTAPPSGFLQISNYEEEFPLPAQQPVGEPLQIQGSRGSALTVRVVYSQPVKLYREANWEEKKDSMEKSFLDQGFLVRWVDAPLGPRAETNALWTGPLVPFDVVQRLLKAAIDQQIPLKKIAYHYHFRSSQSSTEMQLGSSQACAKTNPIPTQTLQQAIAASGEDEFQRVIAPFTCPAPALARNQSQHRNQ